MIKTTIAMAVAAMVAAHAAYAETKVELKVTTFVPPTHFFYADILTKWAAEMPKRTGGQVSIRLFAGSSPFGNVANQADQVSAGVTDAAIGLNGVPRGRLPRTLIMELPLIADSTTAATKTLWSMRESHLAADFKGFKLLGLNCSTGISIFTRDKKVEKLDDLKGLRIRSSSSQIQATLQHIGAVPVTMGPAQIYESIDKRTLDGVAMVYDGLVGFRLESLVKFNYQADLMVTCFHAVMNERKFASLPPAAQKAIEETTGEAWGDAFSNGWAKSEVDSRAVALGKGMTEVPVAKAERESWRQAFKTVIDQQLAETEKQGVPNARAIYDEMVKRAAQFSK